MISRCRPLLIVITGPTASGKTSLAIDVARRLGCDIISADSRQLFRDIPIGTAAPTRDERAAARHHFVATLGLEDYYSAARFEEDALALLPEIFERSGGYAVVCGGSMMYVDALVNGIDTMPTITDDVRTKVTRLASEQGTEGLLALLEITDPDYYAIVDRSNTKRVIHALEISMQAGVPYSSLRTGSKAERPFDTIKFAIDMPREMLFDRINRRVDAMIADGFVEEARRVFDRRALNSLNTVGYKEMFAYFDDTMDFDTAVARIKKNTRVYAKKQLTWLKRDPLVRWLKAPVSADDILSAIQPPSGNCSDKETQDIK